MAAQPAAITVVIPSYRRTGYLVGALRDLGRQDCAGMECIVVLQTRPSEAELAELVEAFAGDVRVYLLDQPNASLARNVGLREARHGLVLFLDDDVRIEDHAFLRKHARNFEDPAVPGVYGQVLEVGQEPTLVPESPNDAYVFMHLPPNYARRCRVRDGGSGNLSVRRDWAVAVGGMDANFIKGARREETEFNLRYTKRYGPLVFDPEARLVHLSADGGSRTWGRTRLRRSVPMHHIVGHWYHLLASISGRTMSLSDVLAELRHVGTALLRNPRTGRDVLATSRNIGRALWGLVLAAGRLASGRRQIATMRASAYVLLAKKQMSDWEDGRQLSRSL